MIPQKPVIPPNLKEVFDNQKRDLMLNMYCVLPGSIFSYNPANMTAQVEIMMKRLIDPYTNESKPYPRLIDVPVFQLSGGTGGFNCVVQKGDPCLILFSDRDIDNWFLTASAQVPNTNRLHDLSDGFALVGFRPKSKQTPPPDYQATGAYKDHTQVSIKDDKIALSNDTTSILEIMNDLLSLLSTISGGQIDIPALSETSVQTVPLPNQAAFNASTQGSISSAISDLQDKVSALLYRGEVSVPPQ